MPVIPADDSPDEGPARATDGDPDGRVPEWAPVEPLPSSEMFLTTFAGQRPVAAGDILDPAFDLVACHCEERLAEAILTDQSSTLEDLRVAGKSLVSARTDIAMLVTIIDEAVRERLLRRRRNAPPPIAPGTPMPPIAPAPSDSSGDALTGVPVHTESVGDIAARMAELWEALSSNAADLDDRAETHLLVELCDAYDGLAAEIEAGRRIPAGM